MRWDSSGLRWAWVAVAATLLCASCGQRRSDSSSAGDEAKATQATKATTKTPSTNAKNSRAEYMQAHFKQALTLKDAVMEGDLEATRAPATWLAEHPAPVDSPDAWIPHITELRQVFAGAQETSKLSDVAAALARGTLVCGRCHKASGSSPLLTKAPEPPPAEDQMLVHAWASDQMWVGLVIPDIARWKKGAAALKDWPTEAFTEHPDNAELARLASELRVLGSEAFAAQDDGTRALVLGKLLATCAACHNAR